MPDFLAAMRLVSERRVRHARRTAPEAAVRAAAEAAVAPPPLRLSPAGFDVIAEIKRRSPGGALPIRRHAAESPDAFDDPVRRLAAAYVRGGAAAVSVLTEPIAFDGSLADLARTTSVMHEMDDPIPAMRKDFIVSAYQVYEARAAGAGGVLLITDLLTGHEAERLVDAAAAMGMWLLVETFAEDGVETAVELVRAAERRDCVALLGVNARNLRTLTVDPDRFARVADGLPDDLVAVAESGLRNAADARRAVESGFRVALIGTSLMAADDPAALLELLLAAGRAAHGTARCS